MNINNSKYAYVAAQWKYGQSDVFMMEEKKNEETWNFHKRIARAIDPSIGHNNVKSAWLREEVKGTREYCKIHDAGGIFSFDMTIFS